MLSIARHGTGPVIADAGPAALPCATSVSVRRFAGFDPDGRFLVAARATSVPVRAISVVELDAMDVGCQVVVAFEDGDPHRPVILGRARGRTEEARVPVRIDGERLVLHGEREIELRCGEASIVLTRAGKVLVKGTYVLSRSRGVNKIKGASVDIN